MFLDQFGWIPRNSNSLENLGLIHVVYPTLADARIPEELGTFGFTDSDWRDTAQTKPAPAYLENLKVKIYTGFPVKEVCLASPDITDLTVRTLSYETGTDEEGAYLTFTLPALAYWDMVFLR